MRQTPGLKLDKDGRVLVMLSGGLLWVIDKLGKLHQLHPPEQLAHPVDMMKDTRFNIGWNHDDKEARH